MSSEELTEWHAYYSLYPWGDERADLRAGIVASTVANCNRGKGGKTFDAMDFVPRFRRKKQTPEQMMAVVRQVNAAVGGREVGSNGRRS